MTITEHFDEQDWERVTRDWTAWWEGELSRPVVMLHRSPERSAHEWSQDFLLDSSIDTVLDYYQARLEATRYFGDAWPKWWPNFGPGIAAGFLGALVHCDHHFETVWFEPAEQASINDLNLSFASDNVWWKRVTELTRAAVERWNGSVAVAHTDLGGNLDILASLRTTEQLLLDLVDAPEEVARLVGEITSLWRQYYDELYDIIQPAGLGTTPWAAIWSPGRCYMLQSDFAYMISPDMFERFVLPDIAACCDSLDHGFYHLDGKGQIIHLDMLLSLDRLRGIQWIPGDGQAPPERWLPLLKRIRDAGKLCQLYVTAKGARAIVQELGGRGFALAISESMSKAEAHDFLRLLAADSAP